MEFRVAASGDWGKGGLDSINLASSRGDNRPSSGIGTTTPFGRLSATNKHKGDNNEKKERKERLEG